MGKGLVICENCQMTQKWNETPDMQKKKAILPGKAKYLIIMKKGIHTEKMGNRMKLKEHWEVKKAQN